MILSALVLCAAVALAQQAPGANGEWDLTINSPQGSRTIKAVFKQEGEKLSGALRSQRGEVPIQGTVKGNEVKFSYPYKTPEMEFEITMTGTLDGNSIEGTADFGGFAQGDWSAVRAGAAAQMARTAQSGAPTVVSSGAGADVTGTWEFQVETAQGAGTPTFTFKQEGEKLTGQYKGTFGEAPLTGTVKGNQIEFTFKVTGQFDATVTYTGTIEGATMKGTAKFGDLADATWTAKRK